MKKKKTRFSYAGLLMLLLLIILLCYKIPCVIREEQGRLSDRWNSFRLAWESRDYNLAYRELDVNGIQLLFMRRPAKFLYWQAETLEKLNRTEKAEAVRRKLLKKYPADYYAFMLIPNKGGLTAENFEKFCKKNEEKFQFPYKAEVSEAETKTGVDSALVWAVMKRESKFNPAAVSNSGAIGLMQVMPRTGLEAAEKYGISHYDLRRPKDNILLGTFQLRTLLRQFDGDIIYSMAAYNAGASNVFRWRKNKKSRSEWVESIPYPETREFVRCVYENYNVYKLLRSRNNLYKSEQ